MFQQIFRKASHLSYSVDGLLNSETADRDSNPNRCKQVISLTELGLNMLETINTRNGLALSNAQAVGLHHLHWA